MSEADAECLLSGESHPEFMQLSALFESASELPASTEAPAYLYKTANPKKRRSIHIAVASVAAVASLSFGGVAAANNALPAPVQSVTAKAASHAGLDFPEPVQVTRDEAPSTDSTNATDATDTTVTIPPPITEPPRFPTTTVVAEPAKPGATTCEAAREVAGARGCSEVAKAHAPGQAKKAKTTTTTSVPKTRDNSAVESSKNKGKSNNSQGKGKGLEKKR